jgi:hypothetical protein
MAKDAGQKRSVEEITRRIERSRFDLGRDLDGLRYELDIPLKIKKSFQRKTVLWIAGAVVLGLIFTVGPARKKKIYVDAKGKRKRGPEKLAETGLLLTGIKFATSVLKPVVVNFVVQKMKNHSAGARSQRNW